LNFWFMENKNHINAFFLMTFKTINIIFGNIFFLKFVLVLVTLLLHSFVVFLL
jgi:hypothetical protein